MMVPRLILRMRVKRDKLIGAESKTHSNFVFEAWSKKSISVAGVSKRLSYVGLSFHNLLEVVLTFPTTFGFGSSSF